MSLVDNGLRVLIAGLVLMGCCSGLLGVLLGWKLRGNEVRRLKNKVAYLQEQLREAWSKKASIVGIAGESGGKGEVRRIDIDLLGGPGEQCGVPHPDHPEWLCVRRPGHILKAEGQTKHGYAGIFW